MNTFKKRNPTVATDVHNPSHNVITSAPIGSTVHDSATVTGTAGTPTGTADFTVYAGNTTCSGNGSAAGSVSLNGSGVADPSSSSTVPVGGLSYRAHYGGDVHYNAADGPCEALTGTKVNPTVNTSVHDASHNVITSAPIGSTVHDSATVSGSAGTPTGSVSFTVYSGSTDCSGTGAAAGSVSLDGSGVADPSSSSTVPVGGLSYKAHYAGDSAYNPGDGPCESLAATKLTPTVATDVHDGSHNVIASAPIGSTVHDSATVSGSQGTPTGSVDFTVYLGTTDCSAGAASAGSHALNASGVADPSLSEVVIEIGRLAGGAHVADEPDVAAEREPSDLPPRSLAIGPADQLTTEPD
jgi:hypothetical protein